MKRCDICYASGDVHFRVRSDKFKNWIFCCKGCWKIISKHEKYSYGGTRKS